MASNSDLNGMTSKNASDILDEENSNSSTDVNKKIKLVIYIFLVKSDNNIDNNGEKS